MCRVYRHSFVILVSCNSYVGCSLTNDEVACRERYVCSTFIIEEALWGMQGRKYKGDNWHDNIKVQMYLFPQYKN